MNSSSLNKEQQQQQSSRKKQNHKKPKRPSSKILTKTNSDNEKLKIENNDLTEANVSAADLSTSLPNNEITTADTLLETVKMMSQMKSSRISAEDLTAVLRN